MPVLYLCTSPKPAIEQTDAVYQEMGYLKQRFGGEIHSLYPFKKALTWYPQFILGLDKLPFLIRKSKTYQYTHFFAPRLKNYLLFKYIESPLIYSLTAGLDQNDAPSRKSFLSSTAQIITSNLRDQKILESWGFMNTHVIRPGINLSHIYPHKLELKDKLVLLMASAPWVKSQFKTKGIDLLLSLLKERSDVKLILLWRGLYAREIEDKIEKLGLQERVILINKKVNISDILQQAHATLLLVQHQNIVKSFPHSLIESISAGKPVIISQKIPMAEYIKENNLGLIMQDLKLEELNNKIDLLKSHYAYYASNCQKHPREIFSREHMIIEYEKLYGHI